MRRLIRFMEKERLCNDNGDLNTFQLQKKPNLFCLFMDYIN